MFEAPTLEYLQLAPLICVFLAGSLGVGVEAPGRNRRLRPGIQTALVLVALLLGLAFTVYNWLGNVVADSSGGIGMMGSVAFDSPTHVIWIVLLVLTILTVLLFGETKLGDGTTSFTPQAASLPGTPAEKEAESEHLEHTEVFPLAMFALTGMMLFPAANDLLTMFVALEIMSLPLYLLCGLSRRRRLLSQEAALKYFMLGSFSSAFFVMGMAFVYGYAGGFELSVIAQASAAGEGSDALLIGGIGLMAVGLLFKIGAVPFHNWTPDVYQGAPTPVTAFMAACTKIAGFGALLRVFYVAFGGVRWDWQPFMAVIAVLTMFVGAILAIVQTDIKRLLAYSSVAHAGFLLTAFVGAAQGGSGLAAGMTSVSAVLFYLAVYGLSTMGAFGIVMMVRDNTGEVGRISAWAGIGRTHPWIGACMALFMLSFAGIPLTSGFMGKLAVFGAAWQGGFEWLVVVAVLASLVAAYFYLRVIVVMFFREPTGEVTVKSASWRTMTTVGVGAVTTIGLGILPGVLMGLTSAAGEFIIQ